jgi:hypothetical protein
MITLVIHESITGKIRVNKASNVIAPTKQNKTKSKTKPQIVCLVYLPKLLKAGGKLKF